MYCNDKCFTKLCTHARTHAHTHTHKENVGTTHVDGRSVLDRCKIYKEMRCRSYQACVEKLVVRWIWITHRDARKVIFL